MVQKPENQKSAGTRSIGQLVGDSARGLPGKSHGWLRNWFRKVWKVRGGGLYALGFALSFLYFEFFSLAEDIGQIGNLFNGQAVAFVVAIFIDSLKNTLYAFMWPAYVAQFAPPWGAIALGAAFVLFSKFLQAPIEKWLFADASEGKMDPR